MPQRRLQLTPAQREELVSIRDRHPLPYLRERAAAVLKVADGLPVKQVALHGLLRPRSEEAVGGWLDRYLAGGVPGLALRPGRGRKPAFSP